VNVEGSLKHTAISIYSVERQSEYRHTGSMIQIYVSTFPMSFFSFPHFLLIPLIISLLKEREAKRLFLHSITVGANVINYSRVLLTSRILPSSSWSWDFLQFLAIIRSLSLWMIYNKLITPLENIQPILNWFLCGIYIYIDYNASLLWHGISY
jgi:hypothetical protein